MRCQVHRRDLQGAQCSNSSRYEGKWICSVCGHAWSLLMCTSCAALARTRKGSCRNDGCGGEVDLIVMGG
jgi:hypothetical protein